MTTQSSTALAEITDRSLWDSFILKHGGHPLQLWGWGAAKATGPWRAYRLQSADGLAQVLIRRLPKPFSALAYCPRGPIVTGDAAQFLTALKTWCKEQGCLELKIEPAENIFTQVGKTWPSGPERTLAKDIPAGFLLSKSHVLINHTAVIDLRPDLADIAKTYSSKTRQYISKAARDGVTVRSAQPEDLPTVYQLYQATAARARFSIHGFAYYQTIWQELRPHTQLFVAESDGQIVAFLWNVLTTTAFELYGGVSATGQKLHANHLLKQTAITDAKSRGAVLYDMNGLLNDGISSFKLSFGQATELPPTLDAPLNPLYYPYELLFQLRRIRHILPRRPRG
jgi:lipid II:glycine glycyltransferase (peptidoglycan interpeptide bridge formation enzyme)